MSIDQIETYNANLTNKLAKIDLIDYIKHIHTIENADLDISFMDYFLELTKKRREYCINNDDMYKYGIITNGYSEKILRCLNNYDMIENINYIIKKIKIGRNVKTEYLLNPDSFKLCLIRSKNSDKYAKYYIFLETAISYYKDYQNDYHAKLLAMKDEKLDRIISQNDDLKSDIKNVIKQNEDLSKDNQKLIRIGERTKYYAKANYNKMNEFLKIFITSSSGDSLFKNILANHQTSKNKIEKLFYPGLLKMKVLAFVGFHDVDKTYIYSIARNIGELCKRVSELYERHSIKENMKMFNVEIVSMLGCDVNAELSLLTTKFYNFDFNKVYKRVTIKNKLTFSNAKQLFNVGANIARQYRFHNYQTVIDTHLNNANTDIDTKVKITNLNNYDLDFHKYARIKIDEYVNYKIERVGITYKFNDDLDNDLIARRDIVDANGNSAELTNQEYLCIDLYNKVNSYTLASHFNQITN